MSSTRKRARSRTSSSAISFPSSASRIKGKGRPLATFGAPSISRIINSASAETDRETRPNQEKKEKGGGGLTAHDFCHPRSSSPCFSFFLATQKFWEKEKILRRNSKRKIILWIRMSFRNCIPPTSQKKASAWVKGLGLVGLGISTCAFYLSKRQKEKIPCVSSEKKKVGCVRAAALIRRLIVPFLFSIFDFFWF